MEAGKRAEGDQGVKKVSFAEGPKQTISGGVGKFSEREKEWFEKIRFVQEKSKEKSLVLGRQLK